MYLALSHTHVRVAQQIQIPFAVQMRSERTQTHAYS